MASKGVIMHDEPGKSWVQEMISTPYLPDFGDIIHIEHDHA